MATNNNLYWMCMIGPVDRKEIPEGGDSILRMAVRNKFYEVFGEDEVCASGWGIDEKRYQVLRILHLIPTKDLEKFIKQYQKSK